MVDADVGVIGAGTVGSFAAGVLARRGLRVLCFEQFEFGHGRGGAGGGTRMFRYEYGLGAPSMDMLVAAAEQWRRLESMSDSRLLELSGGLWIGEQGDLFVQSILDGAQEHGMPYRLLNPAQMRREFPQHRLETGDVAIFDENAGYLHAGPAVLSAVRQARRAGAMMLDRSRVDHLEDCADGVRLRVGQRSWTVSRVLIAAGSWVVRLVPALQERLAVNRLLLAWATPHDLTPYRPGRFPVFIRRSAQADLTGWPTTDGRSVKVSQFAPIAEDVDPDAQASDIDERLANVLSSVVARFVPGLASELHRLSLTDAFTAAGRPILGEVPGMPGVVVIAGLSGRGFKLAPVLAAAAADRILAGMPTAGESAAARKSSPLAGTGENFPYIW